MIKVKLNKHSPMSKYYFRYSYLSKANEAPDTNSCLTLWKEIMNDVTRNRINVEDLDLDFMEALAKGKAQSNIESEFH